MRSSRRHEAGLTLVELMVSGVVLGLVVGVVFKVMTTGSAMFASQARLAEAQVGARFGAATVGLDVQAAGYATTPNCETDPYVADKGSSCTPFENSTTTAVQALRVRTTPPDGLGRAFSYNRQFAPRELWIMTSLYPGERVDVHSQDNGAVLHVAPRGPDDAARLALVLGAPLLAIEQRGQRFFRAGPPVSTVTSGNTVDPSWTLTLGTRLPLTGIQADGMTISAVGWIRYYLELDPEDPSETVVNLVRGVYHDASASGPALRDVVANHVVDLQLSFCLDQSYDPAMGLSRTPQIVCGITDEGTVNGRPERVRAVTLTLRTRAKSEDVNAWAEPDFALQWFDLDDNLANGVARVRTTTRTVNILNGARL